MTKPPALDEPGLPPTTLAVIPRPSGTGALVLYWDGSQDDDAPWLLRLVLFNRSSTGHWHPRTDRRSHAVSVFPEQVPALLAALTRVPLPRR